MRGIATVVVRVRPGKSKMPGALLFIRGTGILTPGGDAMTTMTKKNRVPGKTANAAGAKDKAVIQVRLDAKTRDRVADFFRRRGLTTNAGMRLLIDHALAGNDMPRIPNAETEQAMRDVRAGRTERVLLDDLKRRLLADA